MTAEEFIDKLDGRALLSAETIASLRQFVAKSLKIVTPESLARLLVEKKWLTVAQAKQLLQEPSSAPARPPDDEFLLAPLEDELKKASKAAAKKVAADSEAGKAAATKGKAAAPSAGAKPTTATKGTATAAKQAASAAKGAGAAKPGKSVAKPAAKSNGLESDLGMPLGGAGPLDDLFGEPSLGDSPAGFDSGPLAAVSARRGSSSKLIWILLAGGVFAIAFIIALLIVLGRSNGDSEWAAAEKDFATGSNRDAIAKLDAFLEKFPAHPRANGAAVYRGVARLRQSAASKSDWERTLAVAREVLPKAIDQPDFVKARESLAKLLPVMASGLVKQAKDGGKNPLDQRKRQAEAAAEALAMAKDPRYTPDSTKPWASLQAVENDLVPLMRAVDRQGEFDRAASEIRAAIASGDVKAGIARRDKLLSDWPELHGDDAVVELDQDLAAAAVKSVKVDAERHKGETKPRPSPIVSTVVFAARGGEGAGGGARSPTAPANSGAVATFFRGTAYWIDSGTGMLLGRAYLGFDSEPPQSIEKSGGKDFIAYDAVHQELERLAAKSAAIVWRQPLGGPLAGSPIVRGSKLLCATRAGKLMSLDIDSGDVLLTAQLAEPLRSAPALSADGAILYLVTDRGNLIVLSASDFRASGVTRLGSDQGAITHSPVEFGKHLIIVERKSFDEGTLRVLALGGTDSGIKTVQEIPFAGRLNSPPIAESGRLIVATSHGAINVFSTNGPATAPLTKVAETPAEAKGQWQPRFAAAQPGRFSVGGQGIAQYDPSASGNLRPKWQALSDEVGVAPPTTIGDTLIVATTDEGGRAFVSVKGLDTANGKTKWETLIGAPLAGPPAADSGGKAVRIVHPFLGAIEQGLPATGAQEIVSSPRILLDGKPAPFADYSVPLADDKSAVAATASAGREHPDIPRLLIADAKAHSLRLVSAVHDVNSLPVVIGDGVLVADRMGQISLIDGKSGDRLAAPCLLPLPPGAELQRCWPGVVPGKPEVLLTDGAKRLFRIGLKDKSATRLSVLAEEAISTPLDSQIVVLGKMAFAADVDGNMSVFAAGDLKAVKTIPLGASVQWGPYRIGDSVLAATDRELFCFSAAPELMWKKPLPYGVPAEGALEQGSEIVLASMTGTIWRVDRKSGEEKGKLALGQPLASGPLLVGKQLVVAAADGTLLVVQGP